MVLSAPHAPLPALSHLVVDALLVCGFLAAGVYLSSERRDEHAPIIDRPDRPVVVAVLIRLTVAPLLLVGVSTLAIGLPTAYIIQAMMPTGLNTLVVGHAYELDLRMIASTMRMSCCSAGTGSQAVKKLIVLNSERRLLKV